MPPSRKRELVEAAERVFRAEGFRAPSVDRVIQEAGVSRMTLYNHFASKDDLIVAAIRLSSERAIEQLDAAFDAAGPAGPDRALGLFDYLARAVMDPGFRGCLFQRVADELDDATCLARREASSHRYKVERRLRGALEGEPEPERLAQELLLVYDGALVRAHIEGACPGSEETPSDAVARARDLAVRLLKG